MAVDEPEGDPNPGKEKLNSPKTYLHISPDPEQHVRSYADTDRPKACRDAVEVVSMDGFTGFKTATTEELPEAVAVMDPFHVVRLAGDALDQCRRRVQQDSRGHRGRKNDPLYVSRAPARAAVLPGPVTLPCATRPT